MKLTAIFLLAACLTVAANGKGQTVTLNLKNVPVQKIFTEVIRQTGVSIVYNESLFKDAAPVTINVKDVPVSQVLELCLQNQPLSYSLDGNMIVIKQKSVITNPDDSVEKQTSPIDITGRVTNAQGEPLADANIIIKRTGKGTTTDANGKFSLKAVNGDDILTISFIGYKTQNIKVGNRTSFPLILDVADNELDKIQIQAYGKTTQRLATGNITTVTAADIEKQPVMNPLQALQGRVAGLVINQANGFASAPFKVDIRGINSLNQDIGTDPLYIIDGVPLTVLGVGNNLYNFLQNGIANPAGGQSPFFNINPADIESIEILKDGDATSIYGSRGANGVILITTKKGKAGKTQFKISVYQGMSKITRRWDMLNTQEYLGMRREAFKNIGLTPSLNAGNSFAPDLFLYDTVRYTDWQRYLWGGIGKTTSAQVSLSGGDARTTFRIGAGYNRSTDVLTASGVNQRGSVSFNVTHHTLNERLSASLTGGYSFSQINQIFVPNAVTLPPNAPPVFDSKGNLNFAQWDLVPKISFPFAQLLQPYQSQTGFLNSQLNISYDFFKGLTFTTSFGYNNAQTGQTRFTPIASQNPKNNPTGSSLFGNNKNNNWIVEPQLAFIGFIGKGKLNVMLGASAQATMTDGLQVLGNGYTNDALLRTISNAITVYAVDNYGKYKYSSVFGRINYNWENKYILNLNARRDGSSRFGPGKQFGNFGSIGTAWIASEEKWFKHILPSFFSFIKLRGSYGTTGSDAVGDYAYLSRWSANGLLTYGGISPLVPLQHTDSLYHWPTTRKLEIALDFGLMKDRITFELTYYRTRTNDQLVQFPTTLYSGFSSVIANSPANVQNSGLEFLLNAKIVNNKNFRWTINFNTAINRNKLLSYPNIAQSPYANTYAIGQSLSIQYKLNYIGVDPQTGQYAFVDKNHDGQITYNTGNHVTDDSYAYDIAPKFTGGFGNYLNYKNWSLSVFFVFVKQLGFNALYNGGKVAGGTNNISTYLFNNRWKKPGDITTVARFNAIAGTNSDVNFLFNSNGVYTDASFVRLANLSLSYNLSEKISKKVRMNGVNVFLQGQNLFLITKYKGIDPETQNFGGMPPVKIFTGGITLSL